MIHARLALIWHPLFFGLLLCRTQSKVGFIRADMHPAASVATFAFAAHPEFRKRSLQESDHPIDVTHGEIRMFEPNSHRPPPIQPMVAEYTPAACHPLGCACERSFLRAVWSCATRPHSTSP